MMIRRESGGVKFMLFFIKADRHFMKNSVNSVKERTPHHIDRTHYLLFNETLITECVVLIQK